MLKEGKFKDIELFNKLTEATKQFIPNFENKIVSKTIVTKGTKDKSFSQTYQNHP
jgi:hypothetical protein